LAIRKTVVVPLAMVACASLLTGCASYRSAQNVDGTAQHSMPASRSENTDDAVRAVVQRQLDAYNRRDLEAFVAQYAPDVRIYAFPDKLLFQGHEKMRADYGPLFAEAVGLHAEVTDRIVQGRFVIDREVVTGMPGKERITGLAIYEVTDGRISAVWFVD
jgi:uncharacterized protein (TIGR02246 family)